MADGLNRWTGIGNLGQDPELRMTQSGTAVMNLSLACSETYLDKNKVRQERTEWVRIVLWGKRAEALSKFLRKGARIYVEGGLRTSSYEDREGNKRYKTEVNAMNIILCGGKRGSGGSHDDGPPADDGCDDGGDYDDGSGIPF